MYICIYMRIYIYIYIYIRSQKFLLTNIRIFKIYDLNSLNESNFTQVHWILMQIARKSSVGILLFLIIFFSVVSTETLDSELFSLKIKFYHKYVKHLRTLTKK